MIIKDKEIIYFSSLRRKHPLIPCYSPVLSTRVRDILWELAREGKTKRIESASRYAISDVIGTLAFGTVRKSQKKSCACSFSFMLDFLGKLSQIVWCIYPYHGHRTYIAEFQWTNCAFSGETSKNN